MRKCVRIMVCAIFKSKQLDIVPLVLCIGYFMDCIRITATSHSVAAQYSGSGLVSLAIEGALKDTEGIVVQCVLSGSTHVDIVWKWRDAHTLNIDHYFEWYTTDITFGGSSLSSSVIAFKNGLSNTDRRDASGVIYAEGAHEENTNIKIPCNDVSLTIIWKPAGTPSLSLNKSPVVTGEDITTQLNCQLTDKGNPKGQVRWVKNGNLQSESEYNTQTISIPVTKDINGDKWQCYYYNTAGDGDYSDEVIVTVHWKPERSLLSINKDPLVIGEDSKVQLTCQLTDKGNPESQLRWIKNGNLQSESEYNTQIINIPVTKDIKGDKWQCYYSNTAGDGDYSYAVMIKVNWKPEKPLLSINKEPLVIGLDSTAQMTCQLSDKGNPKGQVRWSKNGILQSASEYNTQTISILVTKDINSDKWQCYYYNTAGDGDYSNEVRVNVHWSPGSATISADTHTPTRDRTLYFMCTGDRGHPPGRVLWYLDTRLVANTTSKQYKVTKVQESHNGNWSCMFTNYLNDGAQSQSIQLQVVLTPEQGEVRITSVTAQNVVVNATPKSNTQKARRSMRSTTITNMIITWYSDNDQNNTVLLPPDTTQYALYNLTANKNYTIEVSYVNDQGIGAAATAYVTTKALPLNKDPIITRSWLSAVVTLDIVNPGSVAQVDMLVCGSIEDMNCANNSINDVQTGNLEAKISSINGRYVVVSLYDEGFLISMFSDNIDAPVLAITLIVLGTLLVVGAVCVVIVVIIRKTRTSTPTEKSELYENVGADKRSVPGGINNVNATPDYEYLTHNAASTSNNTESSTYMGLDQTSLQRTKEKATELTVYQSLN